MTGLDVKMLGQASGHPTNIWLGLQMSEKCPDTGYTTNIQIGCQMSHECKDTCLDAKYCLDVKQASAQLFDVLKNV